MKRILKVIDCKQQLQVQENVVGFEKALGAVKVIKDQIQYRSQSLLNLARGYFRLRQRSINVQPITKDGDLHEARVITCRHATSKTHCN